jgi:hypothetical protein
MKLLPVESDLSVSLKLETFELALLEDVFFLLNLSFVVLLRQKFLICINTRRKTGIRQQRVKKIEKHEAAMNICFLISRLSGIIFWNIPFLLSKF